MFSTLDTAIDAVMSPQKRRKTESAALARACDQCKLRKVRCTMTQPCVLCLDKGFECTFARPRKKRGPTGKRIARIYEQQQNLSSNSPDEDHSRPNGTTLPAPSDDGALLQTPRSIHSKAHTDVSILDSMAPTQIVPVPPPTQTHSTHLDLPIHLDTVFEFPSLPMDSPSSHMDTFGALHQPNGKSMLSMASHWPSRVNEATLLPWVDIYFKRLQSTIPILNRATMYRDMLQSKHHTDPQYGAMLLSLCAFAMTQPVQIHEVASAPSRSTQARMLLQECVKMRATVDFGEEPTLEMILTSFFIFAFLFGSNQHKAAWHRLRESVDLAYSLGIHELQAYANLEPEVQEQWLRTYLVLSVTERAYALQKGRTIDFRGHPSVDARFLRKFYMSPATECSTTLIRADPSDVVGMAGLLILAETFNTVDESIIECWHGCCKRSDGICERFDRRRAIQIFRAQHRVREAGIVGSLSLCPSKSGIALSLLMPSQQADISVTQLWLLNRLWNLCLSHGLLRDSSEHTELQFAFACHLAYALWVTMKNLPFAAMEVHGVGLAEKMFDIGMAVVTVLGLTGSIDLDTILSRQDCDVIPMNPGTQYDEMNLRALLQCLKNVLNDLRGGDHQYGIRFEQLVDLL